jgi:hypothetical protein
LRTCHTSTPTARRRWRRSSRQEDRGGLDGDRHRPVRCARPRQIAGVPRGREVRVGDSFQVFELEGATAPSSIQGRQKQDDGLRRRLRLALQKRIREALATPGRPGIRVIAERFGVNPSTVQRTSCPEQPCRCARLLTPWQARPRYSSTDFCKRRTRSLANGKGDYATELLIRWTPHTLARQMAKTTTRLSY